MHFLFIKIKTQKTFSWVVIQSVAKDLALSCDLPSGGFTIKEKSSFGSPRSGRK